MANEETPEKKPDKKAEKKSEKKAKSGGDKRKTAFKIVDKQMKGAGPPRLLQKYREELIPALMTAFSYGNKMQVPKLTKITVNMGLGAAVADPNIIATAHDEITLITGQRGVVTRAKKSISNFKLRQGVPIGAMVTLRRERMWEFLDRLVSVALPRVRDFKGISPRAFDGRGNYSLGLREQTAFPEINYDHVEKTTGMNITFVTTAKTDAEAKTLLNGLGLPFRT